MEGVEMGQCGWEGTGARALGLISFRPGRRADARSGAAVAVITLD
jgi:hypothetical protein